MTITDRDRKLLWARSHNACAMCRNPLTGEAGSPALPGLVFGVEAHIVARREDGPRGRGDRSNIDGYENLLLLCPQDHKRIDDQPDDFTVEKLTEIKSAHETWAAAKFFAEEQQGGKPDESENPPFVQVKATDEDSIPFDMMMTGKQVWDVIESASLYYFQTVDGDVDREAAGLADDFLTTMRDWGDIADDVRDRGFAAVREAQESIQELLLELVQHGLFVYGRRVVRTIKGGVMPPSPWPTAFLVIMTVDQGAQHVAAKASTGERLGGS
jgi:hypothetical protein